MYIAFLWIMMMFVALESLFNPTKSMSLLLSDKLYLPYI